MKKSLCLIGITILSLANNSFADTDKKKCENLLLEKKFKEYESCVQEALREAENIAKAIQINGELN